MKNDIKKVEEVTFEMKLNDIIFRFMQSEYDRLVYEIEDELYDDIDEMLDRLYFYRRVMSILENYDLPEKAVIGLFCSVDILDHLYSEVEDYIGDSDTDNDIYRYVIEYGYRAYDDIAICDETPQEVLDRFVLEAFQAYGKEGVEDDE